MTQVILFLLLGLGTGALIAAVALSVVLTYRGSGVLNLGAGAVAMLAGYLFYTLRTGGLGLVVPVTPAIVLTLIASAAVGAIIEVVAFRPLHNATPLAKLIASLGVLLILLNGVPLIYGTAPLPAPKILPSDTVTMFNVIVPIDRFILAGIVVLAALVLTLAYRWSRFGLATRAAAEAEELATLDGLSARHLALANTMLGSLVAGGLGILAGSLGQLNASTLTLTIVPALAAALIGRFTSFGIAAAAGLLIGMGESLLFYVSTLSWFPTQEGQPLPGVQELLVFVTVVVALSWRGASIPQRGEVAEASLPSVPRPERLLRPAVIAFVLGIVALIVLPYGFRQAAMTSMVAVVLALSVVVITGYVGQLSVVQLALSGISAFAISHMASSFGIGFPLAPIIAVALATVVGIGVGVSALRVRGVSLVVVTLAAAVMLQNFVFNNAKWGGGLNGAQVKDPHLFGLDLGPNAGFRGLDGLLPSPVFGFLIVAIAVLACVFVANLRRVNLGLRMLAVRSNERAAAAAGIEPRLIKVIAFGLSSTLAGVAGVLYAYNFGAVSASSFEPALAITFLAFVYVFGITSVRGAVLTAPVATAGLAWYILSTYVLPDGKVGLLVGALGGVGLLVQLRMFPDGVAGAQYRKREENRRRREAGLPEVRPMPIRALSRLFSNSANTARGL